LLLIDPREAEWTPFQTHRYSENLVAPRTLTIIPKRRSGDHFTDGNKGWRIQLAQDESGHRLLLAWSRILG
jgi:hypothetical protein